jgi:hypothetical protein
MSAIVDVDLGTAERPQHFICPLTGREVDCTLLEDTETRQIVGVSRCSRFAPADDVRCDQRCAEMVDAGFTLDSDGDG